MKITRQIKLIKDFKDIGIKVNLIMYVLKKGYRQRLKNERGEYYSRKAELIGYLSTDKTPQGLFNEVVFDKVYYFKGFLPKEDDIVVDIGAYYGDSAIWYAKEFRAKVIAFEPVPEAYKELLKNAKLNHVINEILAYNVALGRGKRLVGGKGNGTMFSLANKEDIIQTKTLDSFRLNRVDLLKVDVEGFEYEVLNGAINTIKKFKPKIIIETHNKELKKKCNAFLIRLGYKLTFRSGTIISKQAGFDQIVISFYACSK